MPQLLRRPLPCLLALCSLYAPLASGAELTEPETAALLQRLQASRAKSPSLTADFTEEKTTRLLKSPQVGQGTIAFQAPNKFRRELKGSSPSLTVSNGEKLWIYYPNFKEAELYGLGQRQAFDDSIAALTAGLNFDHVAQYYKVAAFSEEGGHRLVLTPKSGSLKRMVKELVVWVDASGQILRTRTTLPKDDQVTTTYRNARPAPVAASLFEFAPPSETRVSQPLGK